MSLPEVVLEIAEEMKEYVKDTTSHPSVLKIESWSKQLSRAVKATEGNTTQQLVAGQNEIILGVPPKPPSSIITQPVGLDPWDLATREASLERQQKQNQKRIALAQEELQLQAAREERGSGLVMVVGGGLDGEFAPVDSGMPIGAKTLLSGQVYVLGQDRKLHFSEEETQKHQERRKQ